MPYITLHMMQVGITIEEVAVIYLILPFASCVGPPIAGEFRHRVRVPYAVLILKFQFRHGC